jgi:hypothetical protein
MRIIVVHVRHTATDGESKAGTTGPGWRYLRSKQRSTVGPGCDGVG